MSKAQSNKKLRILVVGGGGREHALVWKIAQSPRVEKIFCAPGNPGTAALCENVPIPASELAQLAAFANKESIDITIVGPEATLVAGIVDMFEKKNLAIVGPSKAASQIEGSKVFAKKLMKKYKIPTAAFEVFDNYALASQYIRNKTFPLVIKAEGPCLGKGVEVCETPFEAQNFLRQLMMEKVFGEAGNRVVIEEKLEGQEVSFIVATDGKNFVSLLPSQDHKRAGDGDTGPNTGGMGAYTPVPFVNKRMITKIEKKIVIPTIKAMAKEGTPYKGFLYPGLILTKKGPIVLEYNSRLGDPETQPLMMQLKSDIVDVFDAIVNGTVKRFKLQWHKGASACVVLASGGYPGEYEKGKEIIGLERLRKKENVVAFHSGTKKQGDKIVTNGGRVLGITSRGKNLKDALKKVYASIGPKGVHFEGMHYRKDIGKKGLKR